MKLPSPHFDNLLNFNQSVLMKAIGSAMIALSATSSVAAGIQGNFTEAHHFQNAALATEGVYDFIDVTVSDAVIENSSFIFNTDSNKTLEISGDTKVKVSALTYAVASYEQGNYVFHSKGANSLIDLNGNVDIVLI